MVKPNSFFLLHWGLFFHPGPTLPSWARITYLSPPLPLQPGRGNHTSLSSQRPKSTVCVLHPHSQGWFDGRKKLSSQPRALFSWLGTPRGAVLTSPLQFWTTFLHLWGEMWARAYSKLCFRSCLVGCDLVWIPKKDPILLSILIHAKVRWCDWDVKLLSQTKDFLNLLFWFSR